MEANDRLSGERLDVLARKILSLLGSGKIHEQLITELVLLVQRHTGFQAVGLRLADGLDYPYFFTRGFEQNFVEKEKYLCARDPLGEIIRDSKGDPCLECMCGNVIQGRTDPVLPFFTKGGSFWTNSTTELLASTTEEDRQARTRNRCNGEGYESVALVPVKAGGKTYGLLQLNDKRRGRLTPEFIGFMEGVCVNVALLFAMKKAQDDLTEKARDVARLAEVRTRLLQRIARELEKGSPPEDKHSEKAALAQSIRQVIGQLDILKGFLPICCRCKKIRTGPEQWERIDHYVKNRTQVDFSHTYCPECYEMAMDELDKEESNNDGY